MKIILLIAIMIISLATVGYGATISTVPAVHKIGSEDNTVVQYPLVNITNITLRESGANVNRATVSVENQDSVAHTYKVCAILKSGASLSGTVGSNADCVNTVSVNPNQTRNAVINLSKTVNTVNLTDWSFSVQEIV